MGDMFEGTLHPSKYPTAIMCVCALRLYIILFVTGYFIMFISNYNDLLYARYICEWHV